MNFFDKKIIHLPKFIEIDIIQRVVDSTKNFLCISLVCKKW